MEIELERLVLIDLETTGLEEENDVVCEVGLKVVDLELNVIGQWHSLCLNDDWRVKMARKQVVWDMHTKSGLIADLDTLLDSPVRHSHFEPNQVAFRGWQWLVEDMGLPEGKLPMMGSSVQFDRDFTYKHLIVLNSFFTYRNIDVSTLKELCMRYNPELYRGIKAQFKKSEAKHRVLDDIDATLAEFRLYRDNFLFIPGGALGVGDFVEDENQPVLPGLEEFGSLNNLTDVSLHRP